MRNILLLGCLLALFSCQHSTEQQNALQTHIDSLESRLADTYKPGFGEFMSSIQAHHAKLWFAGQNRNWRLADFEVHEIMETLDDIQKYQAERKETQLIRMIYPALDSVNLSIQQQDAATFKSNFVLLTNTCNNCHQAAEFEFNVVKIPEGQPFSNQDFSVHAPAHR